MVCVLAIIIVCTLLECDVHLAVIMLCTTACSAQSSVCIAIRHQGDRPLLASLLRYEPLSCILCSFHAFGFSECATPLTLNPRLLHASPSAPILSFIPPSDLPNFSLPPLSSPVLPFLPLSSHTFPLGAGKAMA